MQTDGYGLRAGASGTKLIMEAGDDGSTREDCADTGDDGRAKGHRDWRLRTPATMEPEKGGSATMEPERGEVGTSLGPRRGGGVSS